MQRSNAKNRAKVNEMTCEKLQMLQNPKHLQLSVRAVQAREGIDNSCTRNRTIGRYWTLLFALLDSCYDGGKTAIYSDWE
jgi:hypothetical protein